MAKSSKSSEHIQKTKKSSATGIKIEKDATTSASEENALSSPAEEAPNVADLGPERGFRFAMWFWIVGFSTMVLSEILAAIWPG